MNKDEYKVLKRLCNQYEYEQRQIKKSFEVEPIEDKKSINLLDYVDLYYNGYYLYALDKTENRPDIYLKQLKEEYGHLDIILDLKVCNSFGEFNGKEIYLIESQKKYYQLFKRIKKDDENYSLISFIIQHYRLGLYR